ncbi:MAG: 50S ribosomal protein L11 methyltransferase [Bacteroidales bacterium]|nr:50S ribosomal protein L11 methyltransferase [Bacteroidales bacterium]
MNGDYKAVTIRLLPNEEWLCDLIANALGDIGFEAFEETEQGIVACIDSNLFEEALMCDTLQEFKEYGDIAYKIETIEARNWNERWEIEGRKPITVGNLYIHPSTLPKSTLPYDITIDPRQSFGTGAHITTRMILQHLQDEVLQQHTLLDVGTGTGVIAILASMMGANNVAAVEIEEGAVRNARDNFALNNVEVDLHCGSIEQVSGQQFDFVVANINRNILTDMMGALRDALANTHSQLILSGFLEEDEEKMRAAANTFGMEATKVTAQEGWLMMVFKLKAD